MLIRGSTDEVPLESKLSEIRSLMGGHTDRDEEARIITIFREAPADELNQLMEGFSLREFRELLSDLENRMVGPDSHTAFLNLLAKERVTELTVESRVKFIQALQQGSTGSLDEQAIVQVVLATHGELLTALKNLLDQSGDAGRVTRSSARGRPLRMATCARSSFTT